MTIDEIIRLLREIDEEEREEAYTAIFPPYADDCIERAGNCKQLADWLEELKELREFKEKYYKGMEYAYSTYMYRKAIDDFIKKLEEHEHNNWVDHLEYGITWNDIEQIANELKECANE